VNETGLVFGAEFARRIRSRPYILATVLGALAIALVVEAPALFNRAFSSQAHAIVLAGPAALRVPAQTLFGDDFRVTASVDALPQPVTIDYLDAHGKAGAAVLLSQRGGRLYADVFTRDLSAWDDVDFRALAPLGVQVATGEPVSQTQRYVTVEKSLHSLDAKFADTQSAALGHGVAIGLVTVLYISILISAQAVVASVAEEKTSRIAEVLVATISPVSLLTGKTMAAGALALLQIAVWAGAALAFVPSGFAAFSHSSGAKAVTGASFAGLPQELALFVAFFILGFAQYATIYAAAASLISRTEDLGSVSGPIVMPAVGGFLIAQFAMAAPNAPFVVACSFMPFLSPYVMFTRLALETVPAWQIGLSLAINAVAAVACFWAAGKVYRVGMLLYGKLPSPRQVLAVLRS
jgi:ABC-2 type transport system permease protein